MSKYRMANPQRTMLTRRRFVAGLAVGAGIAGIPFPGVALGAGRSLASAQLKRLQAALPSEDQKFDPFAKMLVASAADGPGYHSTRKTGDVHPTRASLNYAAALLDTGEGWRVERANQILRVVIGLQDTDTFSKTHGLWPWSLEEPLAKMSPPDFDSADFCAMPLLMCWMLNRERIDRNLLEPLRIAIVHAAQSIQRRDVSLSQTSIAVLGTAVTLLAAQELKLPELRAYAKDRLRRLHAHIVRQGSFAEYNSPTDTVVVLQELSRLLWLLKDSRDQAIVAALHDRAWKHVADHFHPPTAQWAGPHSRSYETDLRKRPATLAFLQSASGSRLKFVLPEPLPLSLEAYRIPIECPRKFLRPLAQLDKPRETVETFAQRDATNPGSTNAIVGTTWLHPHFTLGTVNRGDFWTQRRPFIAYWGTPTAKRFLRLRCLKDGTDFASALMFSAQHQGAALVAVTLCTNHGDAHPSLDPTKDGVVKLKELRLRFELGGDLAGCTVRTIGTDKKAVVIQDQLTRFLIRPLAGSFGGADVRWEFPELGLAKSVDVILHSSEEKPLDLAKLSEAFVCFTFEDWSYDQRELPATNAEVRTNTGRLQARWQTRGRTLSLDVPVKPASYSSMNDALRASIA
jgi:hypothetical protein